MSESNKYFYLKLKDNFFDSEEMKLLESQKNGIEYQNFYLKLCLLSLKSEGRLMYKDSIPYDLNMLSTITRHSIDTVKTAIEVFKSMRIIEIIETGAIYMSDIQTLIGHSSNEAERKSVYRKRIKDERDNVPKLSGQSLPDIEIKTDIDIKLEYKDEKIKIAWERFIAFKYSQFKFRYKDINSEQIAVNNLIELCSGDYDKAEKIVNKSIAEGWKGLFALDKKPETKTLDWDK